LFLQKLWLPFNDSTYAHACDGRHHAYAHGYVSLLNVYARDHHENETLLCAHAHVHAYPCYGSTFIITSLPNYMYITKMALSQFF
jgi:hypothetical protein